MSESIISWAVEHYILFHVFSILGIVSLVAGTVWYLSRGSVIVEDEHAKNPFRW